MFLGTETCLHAENLMFYEHTDYAILEEDEWLLSPVPKPIGWLLTAPNDLPNDTRRETQDPMGCSYLDEELEIIQCAYLYSLVPTSRNLLRL